MIDAGRPGDDVTHSMLRKKSGFFLTDHAVCHNPDCTESIDFCDPVLGKNTICKCNLFNIYLLPDLGENLFLVLRHPINQ